MTIVEDSRSCLRFVVRASSGVVVLTKRKPRRVRKPLRITGWADPAALVAAAAAAEYVGSPEHKAQTNPVNGEPPAPRSEGRRGSDGSRCPGYARAEWARFTDSLRAAIRAGCVAEVEAADDGTSMPKYVWGRHDGQMFQARRRTDFGGKQYKGWWIDETEPGERPDDPDRRLDGLPRPRRR